MKSTGHEKHAVVAPDVRGSRAAVSAAWRTSPSRVACAAWVPRMRVVYKFMAALMFVWRERRQVVALVDGLVIELHIDAAWVALCVQNTKP